MKKNKIKILIALDYNPNAKKVAKAGFSMAQAMKAKVILLHVMPDPAFYAATKYPSIMGFAGYGNIGPLPLKKVFELEKASQEFLDKSKHYLGDKTIQTFVGEGDSAESILKTAKKLLVDIIVMGSHSQRWLENIIMGSVTEKVLHKTSIPLFIIPTKKKKPS